MTTASSSWSQTLSTAVLVGAALAGTNVKVFEPTDILAKITVPVGTLGSGGPFASAATRDIVSDSAIVSIARDLVRSSSRWYTYVGRRLSELFAGKNAESGIPVPSEAVTERALAEAMEYFDTNTPTPSVVPSEEGNVLFVWRSALLELEIEVGPKESTIWAYDRGRGEIWSGVLADQRENFSRLLASLDRR